MSDPRVKRLARLLVTYSLELRPGDRVLIEAEPPAAPLVRELYAEVLQAGGHPHVLIDLPGLEALHIQQASEEQLSFVPELRRHAYETFEARVRIHSASNTRELNALDPARVARRRKAHGEVLRLQMTRGASGALRWVSTLYPTPAYAQEAEMSLEEYEAFVFQACHVEGEGDPVTQWQQVRDRQARLVEALRGHDRVHVRGPDCDLRLSIRDRVFLNACGVHNMPDGEIYTGPVEESVEGWVRFAFPALWNGREVEGVELRFEGGRVVEAHAEENEAFLHQVLETDDGARYVGEFAIGTNYNIQRHTRNILFDEKIGGTMHLALGAGYPETGSRNRSLVHWDMICDLRRDSEIEVDGEVIYRDGQFLI